MGLRRISHFIKDNKTSAYPTDFVFFDTETTPTKQGNGDIKQVFSLGVALYWRHYPDRETDTKEYLHFTNPAQFWEFVTGKCLPGRRLVLVAHNLQFDFMVLAGFSYLRHREFEITKLICNGRVNIYKYRRDKATLLCLDNMNYFNTSLATLGKSVGLDKLTMPGAAAPISEWYTYCQRDVDVMQRAWELWLGFLRSNDLGTFGLTLASQSFNAYRHRFMPNKILIAPNARSTDLERNSYRGGRVECFKLGHLPGQDYFLLDINSMYPYVMKNNLYPVRVRYLSESPSIERLERTLANHNVIADVVVDVNEPIFGVKHHKRLIFPTGTFRVTLTTSELLAALDLGAIRKVYQMTVFDRADIFSEFVDHFYTQRQAFTAQGNVVFAYMSKIMLNSLYGKFGQRNEEWEFVREEPYPIDYIQVEIDAQTGKSYVVRCIAGQVSETRRTVEGYNSFPAISSEVTANARMMLWEFMNKAGRENVFYCDTDSVLVNRAGYDRLAGDIDWLELGKLKLANSSTEVILHNVKDYVISGKAKIKGISRTAEKVSDVEYITYQQVGVRSGLHKGNVNGMVWRRVPKVLKRVYLKGLVTPDQDVNPLLLAFAFDTNWTDYELMLERYGYTATYGGKYLTDLMHYTKTRPDYSEASDLDYTAADRRSRILDDLDKRRAGEMIYQR